MVIFVKNSDTIPTNQQNDLVFDPFIGSGTTAIVAARNGRQCVGVEISKEYCDVAITRYENEIEKQKQATLLSLV